MSKKSRVATASICAAILGSVLLPGLADAQTPPDVRVSISVGSGAAERDVIRVVSTGDGLSATDTTALADDTEYWLSDDVTALAAANEVTFSVSADDRSGLEAAMSDFDPAFVSPRVVEHSDWQREFVAPRSQAHFFKLDCTATAADCSKDKDLVLFLQVEEQDGALTNFVWYRIDAPANGQAFDSTQLSAPLEPVRAERFAPADGDWFSYSQQ